MPHHPITKKGPHLVLGGGVPNSQQQGLELNPTLPKWEERVDTHLHTCGGGLEAWAWRALQGSCVPSLL